MGAEPAAQGCVPPSSDTAGGKTSKKKPKKKATRNEVHYLLSASFKN